MHGFLLVAKERSIAKRGVSPSGAQGKERRGEERRGEERRGETAPQPTQSNTWFTQSSSDCGCKVSCTRYKTLAVS
jgi:hypothetical protein